jgi:hypothetical protein
MHQIEAPAASAINRLRRAALPVAAVCDSPLVPGIYFSWDTEACTVDVNLSRPPGSLLSVEARVSASPRWFSLNISLNEAGFTAGDVIGIVAELAASEAVTLPLFMRSALDNKTQDTTLSESLHCKGGRSISTVLYTVDSADPLAGPTAYHTLVIQLPNTGCTLDIRDLRVFVIPADRELRADPPTLSSKSG